MNFDFVLNGIRVTGILSGVIIPNHHPLETSNSLLKLQSDNKINTTYKNRRIVIPDITLKERYANH